LIIEVRPHGITKIRKRYHQYEKSMNFDLTLINKTPIVTAFESVLSKCVCTLYVV